LHAAVIHARSRIAADSVHDCDRGDLDHAGPSEPKRRESSAPKSASASSSSPGHECEHRTARDRPELPAGLGADLGRGLVSVVEHAQRQGVRLAHVRNRLDTRVGRLQRRDEQYRGTAVVDGPGRLGGDSCLAAPAWAGNRDD
jgi:hypothetical protein